MHVIIVNYNHFGRFKTLKAMLTHYYNLMGWAEGVAAAGARVTVVQRYRRDLTLHKAGIPYHFIAEYGPRLRPWQIPWRIHRFVADLCRTAGPALVHTNGMVFPFQTRALRLALPHAVPLVVQQHAEHPMPGWKRPLQRLSLRGLDAYLFATAELAHEWVAAGIIPSMDQVYEVMEGSSPFTYQPRAAARALTGLSGSPILFWAGNLDANKDPFTILAGFERLLHTHPAARLYMAYRRTGMLTEVAARIDGSPALRAAVTRLGRLSRAEIPYYFNSADLFVQGSAKEGSGLALLDALACGVVPVVTDIPSFRAITANGRVGALWPVGSVDGFVDALQAVLARPLPPQSQAARDQFDQHWSFEAIGRRAAAVYADVLARRATA
ncbi:MAG: glycosyltransferase family 4 protein [Anaerolineales bacterium]|nr:glycosyltransferase family 4 protein [Anaerolineales bacterium]